MAKVLQPASFGQLTDNMADTIRISVDAMGGDVGPRVAIEGAALALRELRNRGVEVQLRLWCRLLTVTNVAREHERCSQHGEKHGSSHEVWALSGLCHDGTVVNTGGLPVAAMQCGHPISVTGSHRLGVSRCTGE